jgi:hypothetical protein
MGEQNEEALDWFDDFLCTLRPKQDFVCVDSTSEPLIKDGKEVGISIQRGYVKLFTTGVEKLYEYAKAGKGLK